VSSLLVTVIVAAYAGVAVKKADADKLKIKTKTEIYLRFMRTSSFSMGLCASYPRKGLHLSKYRRQVDQGSDLTHLAFYCADVAGRPLGSSDAALIGSGAGEAAPARR
jgi:hypothetical protein